MELSGYPSGYSTEIHINPRQQPRSANALVALCPFGVLPRWLTRNTKLQPGRTSRQLALVKRFGYGSIARQIDLLREHVAMSPYTIQACLYYISSRRSATVSVLPCRLRRSEKAATSGVWHMGELGWQARRSCISGAHTVAPCAYTVYRYRWCIPWRLGRLHSV